MTMETNNVIKYHKAEFPKLSSYNARLQTYLDLEWPIGLAQVPEVLAQAGFFYLGQSDQVRCFYCGVGVHTWLPNDDPWEEHAKCYSNCTFLNLMKSPEYERKVNKGSLQFSGTSRCGERDRTSCQEHRTVQPVVSSVGHASLENDFHVVNNSYGMETSKNNLKDRLHHLFSRKNIQLKEENRRLKEERMCKICTDKEISIVLIPCGHFISCNHCAPSFSRCPLCRSKIKDFVKTYIS